MYIRCSSVHNRYSLGVRFTTETSVNIMDGFSEIAKETKTKLFGRSDNSADQDQHLLGRRFRDIPKTLLNWRNSTKVLKRRSFSAPFVLKLGQLAYEAKNLQLMHVQGAYMIKLHL